MTPPTSIDGTDITGATVDGTEVTEITIDGETVFTAGPDTPIVDNFESGNLTSGGWSGNTGSYDVNSSFPVEAGTFSVKYTSSGGNNRIGTSSGVDKVPDVGDTHTFYVHPGNASNSITSTHFASDSISGRNNGYEIRTQPDGNLVQFNSFVNGSRNGVATENVTVGSQWYKWECLHEADGSFTFTFFDSDGETQLAQLTGTDSTHITSGSYDNTNVQLEDGRGEGDAWDEWLII